MKDEFRALDLRCHALLHDVPIHDAWVIDLPGGGAGRTMRDIDTLPGPGQGGRRAPAVQALFIVRRALGSLFRWDVPSRDALAGSYLSRVTPDIGARSLVSPGTRRGPFRMLYVVDDESLAEVRNATVHAFLATALRPHGNGYRLYWGIYVKPVSWFTAIYMALIDPFRRFIVYPALIRQVRAAWARAYA